MPGIQPDHCTDVRIRVESATMVINLKFDSQGPAIQPAAKVENSGKNERHEDGGRVKEKTKELGAEKKKGIVEYISDEGFV